MRDDDLLGPLYPRALVAKCPSECGRILTRDCGLFGRSGVGGVLYISESGSHALSKTGGNRRSGDHLDHAA